VGETSEPTAGPTVRPPAPAPTAEQTARARRARALPKARVEAFSDGVFAIAITLLVLEIAVPLGSEHDLVGALVALWPSYLAYVISFLTIGWVWIGHTAIIAHVTGIDRFLIRLNLALLLAVAFLPFPTKLMGEYLGKSEPERVAVLFYGAVLLVIEVLLLWMWRYVIEAKDLRHPDVTEDELAGLKAKTLPGIAFFLVAMGVSFIVPTVGVLLYLTVSVFLLVPFRSIRLSVPARR
jgi:uncharacterized membrane protein